MQTVILKMRCKINLQDNCGLMIVTTKPVLTEDMYFKYQTFVIL